MELSYIRQGGCAVAELTGPEKRIVDAPSALELAMTARHEAGASALLVTVQGEAEKAQTLLEGAVPGGRVIHLAGDGAESAFRVEPAPGSDPREAIFRACAGADLPLLDMHYDAMSLEDVFLRLTDDQPAETTKGGEEG